jgi:catechol 2,3-dioxygenase
VGTPTLGHLNLRVADVDRATEFYRRIGFSVVRRKPGSPIAFLALDQEGLFQLGLNLANGSTGPGGLDHFALAYSSAAELARACRELIESGIEPVEAHEYGISKSVYFEDPDGNRLELYWEKPPGDWGPEDERFRMKPLDLAALLASG